MLLYNRYAGEMANTNQNEIQDCIKSYDDVHALLGPHHVGSKFEMDSVWSIQRNVNIGGATGIRSPKSDNLNFNTNKGYYSRHGGTSKGELLTLATMST